MFITRISTGRPIAMAMFILTLVIFGMVSFIKLPVDLMPEVQFPYVTVQAVYMGAGPQEIETAVIKPLEEQVTTVSNVKSITSYAAEGICYVILEFNLGTDPDLAAIEVKDKIDAILYRLPRDLQKPVVSKFDINDQPIINLAVTGPQFPDQLREIAQKQVKEELVKINGVASVTVIGGREREIHVNLKKSRLDGLNIRLETVAAIIASQTVNIPAGHVSGSRKEYTVRVQGEFSSIDQIRNIGIPVKGEEDTQIIPLYTIAEIVDSYKEVRQLARFNGSNSVGLSIYKRPDENIVQVSRSVLKKTEELNRGLPAGSSISIAQDRAEFIRESVKNMYKNMLIGIGLTALMLFLFIGDWRITIIAAVIIPSSMIITFIIMQAFGFSLNMITLLALAISIGTLVTNAIIVLENIARKRDSGLDPKEAAQIGASEVATAVVASVLTNVAVFAPMANMEGMTGQFFKSLGLTIVSATLISLFLSFSLAPLMASRMLRSKKRKTSKPGGMKVVLDRLSQGYADFLSLVIRIRVVVVIASIVLFLGTVIGIGPQLGMEFFPKTDQGTILINLEMPSGTSITETDRNLAFIEKRLLEIPQISSVYSSLGGSGTNTGVNFAELVVKLKDKKKGRSKSTLELVGDIRPLLADIPDAKIVVKEAGFMGGRKSESDISVEITGAQMSEILKIADSVRVLAGDVPGLVDFQLSWKAAKPELKFLPDRQLLDEYGTSVLALGMSIRNSLAGNEAAVFRDKNDEYTIRVQYNEHDRRTIDAIENISIQTQKGIVPLKALCEVRQEGGAANVNRKDRKRLVSFMANVSSGATGTKAAELKAITEKMDLPAGYSIHFGGNQEMMRESFRALLITMLLAIILTYMVLAGAIESLVQPILVMVTIPLGLIGILWALFISGQTISMISLMSTIMLIGIVVNNAILIIDHAHSCQRGGMSRLDSIISACRLKFSAIVMMNMAVVLAMIPQALEKSSIQAPFAITAIGGIIVSTCMTLFVIPALYMFSGGSIKEGKLMDEKLPG